MNYREPMPPYPPRPKSRKIWILPLAVITLAIGVQYDKDRQQSASSPSPTHSTSSRPSKAPAAKSSKTPVPKPIANIRKVPSGPGLEGVIAKLSFKDGGINFNAAAIDMNFDGRLYCEDGNLLQYNRNLDEIIPFATRIFDGCEDGSLTETDVIPVHEGKALKRGQVIDIVHTKENIPLLGFDRK